MTTTDRTYPSRDMLNWAYRQDEEVIVERLLAAAALESTVSYRIDQVARDLVIAVRKARRGKGGLDAFLYQYDLSSEEGIALMCTAEAMLRIPDNRTVDELIRDKIAKADWAQHLGTSDSGFVNAATWGLMLTGRVLSPNETAARSLKGVFKGLVAKTGMPVIRTMVGQAMKILGEQFVMGATIDAALKRARVDEGRGYRFSYDMLGEAARSEADAQRYFAAYELAINKVGAATTGVTLQDKAEVSVKLSALHPRYDFTQRELVVRELTPRLKQLALQAKAVGIGLTVDAEEADRLDLSLDIFERVYSDPALEGWEGLGLAIQAYQKRTFYLLDYLIELQQQIGRRIPVRLVKGAYWDSEIKLSQEYSFEGYPVFTRKATTDVSFIACAKKMLANRQSFIPRFATHNARTVATILALVGNERDLLEFQCLHGMGHGLYDNIVGPKQLNIPCRVYAPVGDHDALLPYLVRRLLENGANTSFVNRIADDELPIETLIEDPISKITNCTPKRHPNIPLPYCLYGNVRLNSKGIDFSNRQTWAALSNKIAAAMQELNWRSQPVIAGNLPASEGQQYYAPHNKNCVLGTVITSTDDVIEQALAAASHAATTWAATPVEDRAQCLETMANLLEEQRQEWLPLLCLEGGRSLSDGLSEIREAIDFCRYYAAIAREQLAEAVHLPGPTGESNKLLLAARGPIVCISPWNFPLAIFLGQISAALVCGNPVLAKPAEQTPYIAMRAVQLFQHAGIPAAVLQLLPGGGDVGAKLVNDSRVKGVVFTGSTDTARRINLALATRPGAITPLIAETGGQNAMIADSSALLEQLALDVMRSAFGSAGQRCSALRVLFIQEDIADRFNAILAGAMAVLKIGEPHLLTTDVGPVIDDKALAMLQAHDRLLQATSAATLIAQTPLPANLPAGNYFAPRAYELTDLSILTKEVFGPILHIKRFSSKSLDDVLATINSFGYGLTLGIHSRINETIDYIVERAAVGNIYVNRNIIGAVVGVQPFGGEGLSGTGPKAGGPHYLARLCVERTRTVNTTAAGGNASLMSLEE